MRSEIIRALQAEYEQRRTRNALEEQRRRSEVEASHPDIAALLAQREELIFGSMRGILEGKTGYDGLPAQMERLNETIAKRLAACGYPENWLDPVAQCPLCRDTGYVGDPVREMCACMKGEMYRRLFREVGLPENGTQSFETFDEQVFPETVLPNRPYTQRQLAVMLRDQCRAWADAWPETPVHTVLLLGPSGLGKTFLMQAMARELLQRDRQVAVTSAYRFLEAARRAWFSGQREEYDTLMAAEVLMVDDLGTEPMLDNVTIVQLYNLLNERQTRGLATVLTTNLSARELQAQYGERITSRLRDKNTCLVAVFEGEDLRTLRR